MAPATVSAALLAAGYPVAVVVITRWVAVVRERRATWFVAHAAAMTAIILGWGIRRPAASIPNLAWLLVSTVWYRRSRPRPTSGPGRGR